MNFSNYKFIEKEYASSGLLPDIGIATIFNKFVENENFKGERIGIVTKVKTIQGNIFTIGNKAAIKPSLIADVSEYAAHIEERSQWMESWYTNAILVSVVFVYSEISETDYIRIQNNFNINKYKYSHVNVSNNTTLPFNIPLNNNYSNWGEEIKFENNTMKISSIIFNPSLREGTYILIKTINSKEKLVVFNSVKNNSTLFYFVDFESSNQLIRHYKNKKFIIENENIVLYTNIVDSNNIQYIKKTAKATKNFFRDSLNSFVFLSRSNES